jgi:type IV pilus assembly protein PilB
VLSTLHTNDAPSTINRLMNMGIEPFLVASSLNLVCAQRLVRRICKNCSEPHPAPPEALMQAGFNAEDAGTVVPNKGKGCEKCNNTGYKGPRRLVRGDGNHRGAARADSRGRLGPRTAPQGG